MAEEVPGRLESILGTGQFVVTAEVVPPRSADPAVVIDQARALVGFADAANVTDNPTSSAHMSPVAGVALVAAEGIEPVLQLACRDRNRLGLEGDLYGGWALGARSVLCLSGDPVLTGEDPHAVEVHDLDVIELVRLASGLRTDGTTLTGRVVDAPPRYLIGVADVPLADPYDVTRLERKADAGARFVQTQIVYDLDGLGGWAETIRARGLLERLSVLVGVAPPRSAASARFMREHLPGVVVPDAVVERLERAEDPAAEGVRIAVEVVERVREIPGLAGVHVMGIGREEAVRRVIEGAGLLPRP